MLYLGQPPFKTFPNSRHSGRFYSPELEEQLLDMQRIYAYLQGGRWFRQVSSVGTFSLGGYLYNATTHFAEQTLEITFDSATSPTNWLFPWLTLIRLCETFVKALCIRFYETRHGVG